MYGDGMKSSAVCWLCPAHHHADPAGLAGSSLLGRNIDLQDAFGGDFQLLEEEEEEIEVFVDEEPRADHQIPGADPNMTADQTEAALSSGVEDLASEHQAGPEEKPGSKEAAIAPGMESRETAAPKAVSMLRPPSESMSKGWGLSMLTRCVASTRDQEEQGKEESHGGADDDGVESSSEGNADEDICTNVQVGPGLVMEVARDKDARSKQRSDLLHLYNECLLTKPQYQDALESVRIIGARLDGESVGASVQQTADDPSQDMQGRKASVGGRASRAASPARSQRKSERGVSPAPGAVAGVRSRVSSPAYVSRKSTGVRSASPGPAASPRTSIEGAAWSRKQRLSSSKAPLPAPSAGQGRESSMPAGRVSSISNREDARGKLNRRSAGPLTPRASVERSAARRSVSKTAANASDKMSSSAPCINRSSVSSASVRTGGGMRSIGASSGDGVPSGKTPMRAPLRANRAATDSH